MSRIRIKLFRAIVTILVLCFIFISISNRPILYRVLAHQTSQELLEVSENINSLDPSSITYYFDLYAIAINNNISFEMLLNDGTLIYTSKDSSSALSSGHFPTSGAEGSEFSQTVLRDTYNFTPSPSLFEKRQKVATSAEYFVLTTLLESGETLHIFSPVATVNSNVEASVSVFNLIAVVICLIMSALTYFFVSKFTKPIVEMNDVTRDMAALNFKRKCRSYGNDEVGELGKSINTLSDTLDTTLMDLQDKNEQLERDIERRHALDDARKSFINNVSHELKTPIAIISGYAEGLAAGISDDPQVLSEYCRIINEETKKMNLLVVELLELSKLDSKTQPFTPENYDLGKQAADLFSNFALFFRKHGITAVNNIPEGCMCYAQRDKIEIVLKNYINNAVSHCDGEKLIKLDVVENNGNLRVSVFNTGECISEAETDEIWDSFYRADKSHSRGENRFGLGLSIVKSIMNLHSMPYGVDNVENGVRFWFEISKEQVNNETETNE